MKPALVLIAALLAGGAVRAKPTCDLSPFLAATSWTGTITVTGTASGTLPLNGGHTDYNISQSIALRPVMAAKPGSFTGPENATVTVSETFVTYFDGIPGSTTDTVTANGFTAFGPSGFGAVLSFDPLKCVYSVQVDTFFTQFMDDGQPTPGVWGWPQASPAPLETVYNAMLPSSATTLTGNLTFVAPVAIVHSGGPYPTHWTVNWSLSSTSDLDVVVKIPDYDNWRPTAGQTELETGTDATGKYNLLEIQAQLVSKSTGQPAAFSPDKFEFSLPQVSVEPGVALNWPPVGGSVGGTDMIFEARFNKGFTVNSNGTVADYTPPSVFTDGKATVLLSPRDWGAWATLSVTAKVGGQTIQGHLQSDSKTDILLPKRQANSFIADAWKEVHNIALTMPDGDDTENDPVGDGQLGDGLTLYEEYRGFYVGICTTGGAVIPDTGGTDGTTCQHVEGDPAKKDLFIVNEISAEGDLGIEQFAAASGINVHYVGLDIGQIDANRVINFNHAQGPHEVNQHALVMKVGPDNGRSEAVGGPGLPLMVKAIEISPTINDTNDPLAGIDVDSPLYIQHVSHELAHGSSVWHHGEIDEGTVWWSADVHGNIFEFPIDFQGTVQGNGTQVIVVSEDQDLSAPNLRSIPASTLGLPLYLYVGNRPCGGNTVFLGGQHSGDQFCLMRYSAAKAYVPLGFGNVRCWVTEEHGTKITGTPQGTGVNFASRQPRPRYGDADTLDLRGECSNQLDVNDANNFKDRPTTGGCPLP